ncbi:hypothetical protein V8D89_001693 [Ganoderma adspersum]
MRDYDVPVTFLPHFSRLERLSLEIAGANTRREALSRSFSAVQSTLSFIDSATLKHLPEMRLDYNHTPSVDDRNVLAECRELEQLLLRREFDSIGISVTNARRHCGNMKSTARVYHRLFPALFKRGLLTVVPDTQTHRAMREWPIDGATYGTDILAVSPCRPGTGHLLASCGGALGRIATQSGRVCGRLTARDSPLGGVDGTVYIWDAETHATLYACGFHYAPVHSILFSPGGRWVVTGAAEGTVRVWHNATGERHATLPLGDTVKAMVYHPDGVRFALASGASGVRVFKIISDSSGTRLKEVLLPGGQDEPWTLKNTPETIAFSKDGKMLLWASWNVSVSHGVLVKVWDARSGKLRSRLWICEHDDEPVHAVSFSPDGKYVAIAASRSGQVRVWRTEEKATAPVETFTEHSIDVGKCWATHIAFSPDGTILASGALDGSVFIRHAPRIPSPRLPNDRHTVQ